jgi:hypothetical protein
MCMCAYGHVRIIHQMGLHMCVLDVYICSKSRNWYDILVAPRKTSDRHIELTFIMIAITIGRCILSQKNVVKKIPFCRSPSSENNDEPCPLANGKFRFLPCSVKFSQTTFKVACVLLENLQETHGYYGFSSEIWKKTVFPLNECKPIHRNLKHDHPDDRSHDLR